MTGQNVIQLSRRWWGGHVCIWSVSLNVRSQRTSNCKAYFLRLQRAQRPSQSNARAAGLGPVAPASVPLPDIHSLLCCLPPRLCRGCRLEGLHCSQRGPAFDHLRWNHSLRTVGNSCPWELPEELNTRLERVGRGINR